MRIDTAALPLRRDQVTQARLVAQAAPRRPPLPGSGTWYTVDEPMPPCIGHNGGPPLDTSFVRYCWKRAHREAWKTPPREVVLRRLERARALGMTYREYTAIILDRGVHL
jgi:hypothetical protein